MSVTKINLTLPDELVKKLRARVPPREISRYVAQATAARLEQEERAELYERLVEQYTATAAEDLELATEFFDAEQEASRRLGG